MYYLNLKKRARRKKGVSLIECIVSILIFEMIMGLEITMLLKYINILNQISIESREFTYINETYFYIQDKIETSSLIKFTQDNVIEVIDKDSSRKDYIMITNHNLVIKYGSRNSRYNKILEGVSDFKLKEKDNIVYITIINNEGKKYTRCFGIKKAGVL